jgi:hypothetical protein
MTPFERLRDAAKGLYMAGRWSCDRSCDEAALWTELRDAAEIPAGTATAAGVAHARATSDRVARIASDYLNMPEANFRCLAQDMPGRLHEDVKTMAGSLVSQSDGAEEA